MREREEARSEDLGKIWTRKVDALSVRVECRPTVCVYSPLSWITETGLEGALIPRRKDR